MFFDNATRQTCTVKPSRTNTPLHALLTLNDVTYVEAGRALSRDVLRDGSLGGGRVRLQAVYLRLLSRPPSDEETAVWLRALSRAKLQFETRKEAASELLSIGDLPQDDSLNVAEHAAWTSLVLALFNLDETLSRQ